MHFNLISLVGTVTRDPEQRTTGTGKTLAKFSLAVKKFKAQEGAADADFFDVTAWGEAGERVMAEVGRGSLVHVRGRIESRKYTDRDGNERTAWEVTAERVEGYAPPKGKAKPESSGRGDR